MSDGAHHRQYLKTLGIPVWERRPGFFPERETTTEYVAPVEVSPDEVSVSPVLESTKNTSTETKTDSVVEAAASWDWESLRKDVEQCTACELSQSRTQTVFGVGNDQADWLIIGEAPGKDEDIQGEPFVGRAGQLLNEMLLAIGLKREQVYIANILKCRPPNNRDPQPEEVIQCESFLQRQIEWIKPKIILSVGRISAQNLLKTDEKIGRLRGTVHRYGPQQIPLVATYHPAYLLRSPLEKRKAWEDLKLAMSVMRGVQ